MWRQVMVCGLAFMVAGTATVLTAKLPPSPPACVDTVYRGFDTRLAIAVTAKLPPADGIVGFEMVRGHPVVAFPHRVVVVDGTQWMAHPSVAVITGLAVDATDAAWIRTEDGFTRVSAPGTPTARVVSGIRILNSGTATFALVDAREGRTQLMFRDDGGRVRSAMTLDGPVGAASNNGAGFAMVGGEAILLWPTGRTTPRTLAADPAFARARDVVAVSATHAVVALPHSLVLIGPQTRVVLAALTGRVRWSAGVLYVLDESRRLVWRVSGLDALQRPGASLDRATHLVQTLARNAPESSPAFLEAVRLVGCRTARELRKR